MPRQQTSLHTAPATAGALRLGVLEWGLLLTLSIIWGGAFLFGRIAVQEVPPLTVVWVRVTLAAGVLAIAIAIAGRGFPVGTGAWAPFLVMGIINNVVPFSLIFWAQQEIGAGLAAVLNATTPLFTLILAHLLTRDERIKPNALAGILLGMAGVAILVGPAGLQSFGAPVLPQLAVLGAAFSYGLAGIWGRRLRGYPALTSACCQLTGSSLVLLPAMLLLDRPWTLPMPSQTVIAAMIALALACTALAYVIFFTIVKRAGATNVMLVTLLIPPSAIGLGAIVLGETLDAREIAGAAVILVGLLIIDGRALRALITPMRRTR